MGFSEEVWIFYIIFLYIFIFYLFESGVVNVIRENFRVILENNDRFIGRVILVLSMILPVMLISFLESFNEYIAIFLIVLISVIGAISPQEGVGIYIHRFASYLVSAFCVMYVGDNLFPDYLDRITRLIYEAVAFSILTVLLDKLKSRFL